MKLGLSKKGDHRGKHLVLLVPRKDNYVANYVICEEVLRGGADPVYEFDAGIDHFRYRFNTTYLETLMLAFPQAALSPALDRYMIKQQKKEFAEMPVPDIEIPGFYDYKMEEPAEPYDFQKIGIDEIEKQIDELSDDELRSLMAEANDLAEEMGELPAFFLNDEMGLGKQAPISEPVLTPRGWRRIGAIRVGDQVIGSDGKPTEVLGVFPQKDRRVYRVTFSDGSSTRCGPDHLWATQTTNDRFRGSDEWRIVSVQQMLDEKPIEKVGSGQNKSKSYTWTPRVKQPNGNRNLCIPMVEPVHFARQSYHKAPIDSYLLGVLLGDGALSGKSVSLTTDPWIIEQFGFNKTIRDHHTSSPDIVQVATFRTDLRDVLDSLGLFGKRSWEKFVPRSYLRGTPEQRLALLQGLMDTDGYAHPDGGSEFSTTSQKLAKAVMELAQSLGGVARVDKAGRRTIYDHNGERKIGRKSWRVNVRLPRGINPFRLPRKADAYKLPEKYEPTRWIESIERVEDEASVCIKVAAEDQLYVTKDYIVTHNTIQALGAAVRNRWFPAIFVVPNSGKWSTARIIERLFDDDFTYQVVDGTAAQRSKQINSGADVTIVNFEAIRVKRTYDRSTRTWTEDIKHPEFFYEEDGINRRVYEFAVIDEHHRIKNPTAQATAGFFKLRAHRWLMMSGTPIMNRIEEIWTVLHKSNPTLFPTYYNFEQEICIKDGTTTVGYRPDKIVKIKEYLKTRSIRRRRDHIADDLPEVVYVPKQVILTTEQRRLYDEIRDELVMELEDGSKKKVFNMLTRMTRLKQACFSPELYGGSKKSSKIDEMKIDVEQLVESGEKAIIFSQWSKAARILEREFAEYNPAYVDGTVKGKKRSTQEDKFNTDDDCKLYIGTIGANREAITLNAATYVLFADKDWTPMANAQAAARSAAGGLRGIGLPEGTKVHIIEYLAVDTIEDWIEELLAKKQAIFNGLIEKDGGARFPRITIKDIKQLLAA